MSVKVTDLGMKKALSRDREIDGLTIEGGVVSDRARYPDGTRVVDVAIYQEYGTPTIQPRPFIGPVFAKNDRIYARMMANLFATAKDARDAEFKAVKIAQKMQKDLLDYFDRVNQPALAQSTIDAKGSDKPLVDTGRLRRHIQAVVYKGDS